MRTFMEQSWHQHSWYRAFKFSLDIDKNVVVAHRPQTVASPALSHIQNYTQLRSDGESWIGPQKVFPREPEIPTEIRGQLTLGRNVDVPTLTKSVTKLAELHKITPTQMQWWIGYIETLTPCTCQECVDLRKQYDESKVNKNDDRTAKNNKGRIRRLLNKKMQNRSSENHEQVLYTLPRSGEVNVAAVILEDDERKTNENPVVLPEFTIGPMVSRQCLPHVGAMIAVSLENEPTCAIAIVTGINDTTLSIQWYANHRKWGDNTRFEKPIWPCWKHRNSDIWYASKAKRHHSVHANCVGMGCRVERWWKNFG